MSKEQLLEEALNEDELDYSKIGTLVYDLYGQNLPDEIDDLEYADLAEDTDHPLLLEALSEHDDDWVRAMVASNPHTPASVLTTLAEDEDEDVRFRVASNPNTPDETLAVLADDESEDVAAEAAKQIEDRS
jgi:hypothetical protein